jgi:hypothetical protein
MVSSDEQVFVLPIVEGVHVQRGLFVRRGRLLIARGDAPPRGDGDLRQVKL